jgi:hypothetical protein
MIYYVHHVSYSKTKDKSNCFHTWSEKWIKFYHIWSYLHYFCSWHLILSEKGEGYLIPTINYKL